MENKVLISLWMTFSCDILKMFKKTTSTEETEQGF